MKEVGVQREELFVTSKLWNTYHRPELVAKAFETTLNVCPCNSFISLNK